MLAAILWALTGDIALADSSWFWQNPLPQGNPLRAVAMFGADVVVAVGDSGTIIRSIDGGVTWIAQSTGTTDNLGGISLTDANTGTVVGENGTILRTTDGGLTWTRQSSGTFRDLWAVSFTDADTGTAVGVLGTILRTTTGGEAGAPRASRAPVSSRKLSGILRPSLGDSTMRTCAGDDPSARMNSARVFGEAGDSVVVQETT